MLITRTPYRISFVGGGTDIKSYYKIYGGRVISTSINKFLYVIVKKQIGFVQCKYRINWSTVEMCDKIDEIKNPIARETLRYFNIDFPIEITTIADIPANTGLGSSSAFAVGLVHALLSLKNIRATKHEIASIAAKIEIDILKRNIGKQDHFASSYGGINIFEFNKNNTVEIIPIPISVKNINKLQKNLMFIYTDITRDASKILKNQIMPENDKFLYLDKIKNLVKEFESILITGKNFEKLGELLHLNWLYKKKINNRATSKNIDSLYKKSIKLGSKGGKILGAGGGGFLMLYCSQKIQTVLRNKFLKKNSFNIKIDTVGTRLTYYDHDFTDFKK